MVSVLPCLVISDGRRGIENQALGLAEALGRVRPLDSKSLIIKNTNIFKALPPKLQAFLRPKPPRYGLPLTPPKLVIGCGRQAIAPLLALKRSYGPDVFTIYIQHPRLSPRHFDLVIAPEHDRLSGGNVLSMIGSPNRITANGLEQAAELFASRLSKLPKPRISVLIGGPSKTHRLDQASHQMHLKSVKSLLASGYSVLLSTSRRTPEPANQDWRGLAKTSENIWFYDGHIPTGDNPYLAFLGAADALLVTEDSTNMLCEACMTGRPVFTLPMAGNPGKFSQLYSALQQRCHVHPFNGDIGESTHTAPAYTPLQETDRIALRIHGLMARNEHSDHEVRL